MQILDPRLVRIRTSRRIDHKGTIQLYDSRLATINAYLSKVQDGVLQSQQLRLVELFTAFTQKPKLLIMTTDNLVLINAINFRDLQKPSAVRSAELHVLKYSQILKYEICVSQLETDDKIEAVFFLLIAYSSLKANKENSAYQQQQALVDMTVDPLLTECFKERQVVFLQPHQDKNCPNARRLVLSSLDFT